MNAQLHKDVQTCSLLQKKKISNSLNAHQERNGLLNEGTTIKHKIMYSLKTGKIGKVISVDNKYCPQELCLITKLQNDATNHIFGKKAWYKKKSIRYVFWVGGGEGKLHFNS